MVADAGGAGGGTPGPSGPPPVSVSTPVYDGVTADSADVVFGWAEMTPAAAGLYTLAQAVRAAKASLTSAQGDATVDWRGPYRRDFDAKCEAFKTSCDNVAEGLVDLADQYANAWSLARWQQGKICAARGFAKRESEESGLNKFGDSMFGDESPNEPSQPGVPSAAGYHRTDPPPHEDGCNTTATHGSIDGSSVV